MIRADDTNFIDLAELHGSMFEAMVAGDVTQLGIILADDFTLTHMTGYVQAKAEWLDDIAAGAMRYHRMETVETTVSAEGDLAALTARTLTDATIWGSRATWQLTLRSWFEPRGNEWVIVRTIASTW
ncbi:nuclear transport factor 2 family protein [Arthrobacter psychrolactophilus]